MGLSYGYCCRFIGKPVVVTCTGGRTYSGVVRQVTPAGIVLQRTPYGAVAGDSTSIDVATADQPGKMEIQDTAFGYGYPGYYNPYIALPLFVLLAISLAWW